METIFQDLHISGQAAMLDPLFRRHKDKEKRKDVDHDESECPRMALDHVRHVCPCDVTRAARELPSC